jgi:orotidine-5'-phosphate decarboxylase
MASSLGRKRLAFALDCPEWGSALNAAKQVAPHVGVLKIGLELFVREGPRAVRLGRDLDCDTFLDLKLHDIPETVERAVANICQLGVQYLTVHASGGPRMLLQAVERVAKEGVPLTLLAVTLLTSLDASDLETIGIHRNPEDQVLSLARMAHAVGVPGFVCSTSDVARLRSDLGTSVVLVTPGIRPSGPAGDDQKRVGTPTFAIRAGSNLLVVGRPIRDAKDPRTAAAEIELEIIQALSA